MWLLLKLIKSLIQAPPRSVGEAFVRLVSLKSQRSYETYLQFKLAKFKSWPFMCCVEDVRDSQQNLSYQLQPSQCSPVTVMSSYSYLGLHADTSVQDSARQAAAKYSTGSHGPRMLHGNNRQLERTERTVARFFDREAALLASSGYMACMGAMVALVGSRDLVLADKKIHDCLNAGLKLSGCAVRKFRHNDFCHARRLLNQFRRQCRRPQKVWVVIESVYSMEGSIGDLPAAKNLCDLIGAKLIIDEAHGLGTLGVAGRGLEEHYDMRGCADVIVGTFSKSCSTVGGFICGSRETISACEFNSPSNVFTAGLSAYHAAAAEASLTAIDTNPKILSRFAENQQFLRNKLKLDLASTSFRVGGHPCAPVIPVFMDVDFDRALIAHDMMVNAGFALAVVMPPAVAADSIMFRITATAWYDHETILRFVDTLKSVEAALPPADPEFKSLVLTATCFQKYKRQIFASFGALCMLGSFHVGITLWWAWKRTYFLKNLESDINCNNVLCSF